MYRNLNATALGISGRQSELIELALTFGFRGMDLDMADMVKRVRARGLEHSGRFVMSAKIKIGAFDLPISWHGDEPTFRSRLVELKEIAEIAASLDAHACIAHIEPASDELPYHENFEFHRSRFAEIAEVLAAHDIKLGLALLAAPEHRAERTYEFIHQAEELLTLIKTIASPNVGLALDTWNWCVGGGGMDQLNDLADDQFVSVRLANVPETANLAAITDQERDMPNTDGQVDCAALMRLLGQIDYSGPITVFPHPSRLSGMTRESIVQAAQAGVDDVWRRGGLNRAGKLEPVSTDAVQS